MANTPPLMRKCRKRDHVLVAAWEAACYLPGFAGTPFDLKTARNEVMGDHQGPVCGKRIGENIYGRLYPVYVVFPEEGLISIKLVLRRAKTSCGGGGQVVGVTRRHGCKQEGKEGCKQEGKEVC
jgi:hypothetical protein